MLKIACLKWFENDIFETKTISQAHKNTEIEYKKNSITSYL